MGAQTGAAMGAATATGVAMATATGAATGRRGRGRGAELTRDGQELGQDALVESLEATALGWGELVGKREGRKLLQGDLEAMQVCLELQGSGRAGRIGSGSLAEALERRT